MLITNKKVGETPLELLNRIRLENPELAEERLSYAGRLDPMAEGETLVLVGNENNRRDKEYEATFLFGMSTDTGDALGLITNQKISPDIFKNKMQDEIFSCIQGFKEIKTQMYPWFSSKTVDGIKLFQHYKDKNTDIERPSRDVEIKSVELLNYEKISADKLQNYIFDSIKKVNGDFRQEEIIKRWQEFFDTNNQKEFQTIKIKILVASGTYIRALTENFPIPTTLLKLNRTKIISEL